MKEFYIYLDIDGVLNDSQHPSYHSDDSVEFYPDKGDYVLIDLLKKFQIFCKQTNASVIIISSWATGRKKQLDMFKEMFGDYVVGFGDYTGGSPGRGEAVDEHRLRNGISHYLIIDDCDNYHNDKEHLCVPLGNVGLTDKDFERCWSIYNAQ